MIRIKTGLDAYLIRIQTRTPLWRYPPYDYCKHTTLRTIVKAPVAQNPHDTQKDIENEFSSKGRRKVALFLLSAAAFWGFSRGGFPENACIGGATSERNFCEICRRKSPQNTEKHKTKLCAEVPERPLLKDPFFQLLINWPFFTRISGRNFLPELWGEVHPKTAPLQALRCALCSTEQALFKREKGAERCREKGGKGVAGKEGKKEKRTRENRSVKSPNYPLIRDVLGDLRATVFVWEMLVLNPRVVCFWGWKSPQGLYNLF